MYKLCKTEQSAVRQRQLEQKLMEMMNLRRYEEISVSDFCIFAGIPRKAFYRYFSSKDGALYALLDHTMLEYELFRDPQTTDRAQGLQAGLEGFFRFWKKQELLLDALEHSGLSGILMERAISNIIADANLKKVLPESDPVFRDHVIRFSVCGLMIMMVNWHHGGYQESIAEMTRIAMRLVSQPLLPTVRELI